MGIGIEVAAALPFLAHVLAAIGVISEQGIGSSATLTPPVDTYDWWKHIFINNYRLGPRYGDYSVEIAYVQLVLTAVAFLLHIPNALSVRKFSYAILAVFYAVTQLRHFLFGYGVEEAAYLYINTVVFAILVLHNDKRSRSQSHKKLS